MSREPDKKRDEALVERLVRRMVESMGSVVDRKLGRDFDATRDFTTTKLIGRMKRLIDERAREVDSGGRMAPHHLKLKIEWGTHSEAPPETITELEYEILAAAIDHINDQRLRTLAPVRVETVTDIFTTGISVDPTFGEFEEELKRRDEEKRRAEESAGPGGNRQASPAIGAGETPITTRIIFPDAAARETKLSFKPGGRRLSVGRVADNDLQLDHASVSKIHAALLLNREGTLLVADTGSTNGTYINGRRIAYGEARQIEDGDVVGFGEVEVRFRKS